MSVPLSHVVAAYEHSLEEQIGAQGTHLACRDQGLRAQVEGLLKDGATEQVHCLGLDPLGVMGESLTQATASTPRSRGGLQGLAKAFEVLEQAALNLYLSPWREEYKVVKMYSGTFTHCIKPVLSMPQIEKVFGLLGYRPSSSPQEQLRLQSPASPEGLLRLSCAFFLARCECRLLVAALGSHAGEAEWERSVVRDRHNGHSIQFALENAIKTLSAPEPADVDVDLYTDEQEELGAVDDEAPRSLTWVTQIKSPKAVTMLSNGTMSSSASPPLGEHSSTLNCQLPKTPPGESGEPSKQACREWTCGGGDQPQLRSLQPEEVELGQTEAEASPLTDCPHPTMNDGAKCKMAHKSGAFLRSCRVERPPVAPLDAAVGSLNGPTQSESLSDVSAAAVASLPKPIAYHECCDLAQLDPRVLCISCCVFHSSLCSERQYCQIHHSVKTLGLCECGRPCSRSPLVLCRYCGKEYCRDCWYRTPVECTCGQTFDQSSSV